MVRSVGELSLLRGKELRAFLRMMLGALLEENEQISAVEFCFRLALLSPRAQWDNYSSVRTTPTQIDSTLIDKLVAKRNHTGCRLLDVMHFVEADEQHAYVTEVVAAAFKNRGYFPNPLLLPVYSITGKESGNVVSKRSYWLTSTLFEPHDRRICVYTLRLMENHTTRFVYCSHYTERFPRRSRELVCTGVGLYSSHASSTGLPLRCSK